MDLAGVGGGGGGSVGVGVTLLSYANSNSNNNNGTPVHHVFQQQTKRYSPSAAASQRAPVKKSAEKFLRTLRKRSKSASRLHRLERENSSPDLFSRSGLEDDDPEEVSTYRVNGERLTPRNPGDSNIRGKKEKVQLVGFSVNGCSSSPLSKSFSPSASDLLLLECQQGHARGRSRVSRGGPRRNLDFGGSVTNLASSTNKTSRDVKMERERIRMEKMREKSRLMNSSAETQRRLLLDDRLSVVAPPSPALTTSSSVDESSDVFGQFVRENQERFAQMVQQHRAAVSATSLGERIRLQQQQQQTHTQRALPPMGVSSSSQSPPRVHHIHIQRENLNCELSSVEGSGECEVKRESNSKLKIVVNEEAATVKAKAILQGQGHPKSSKCSTGGSESHSDVGSSCSDEVGEDDDDEDDDDTTRRRRDQDDESDSSTLSSCDSAQLLRLSPKGDNDDDESGAKERTEKGQKSDPEENEIEIKIVREEDGDQVLPGVTRYSVGDQDGEKRDSLGSGLVLKKCLSQIDSVSAVHRSSSSSSRLSSSSSSGFSSIGPSADKASAALQKLQQLQERRSAFHHPTFANHFGFGRSGTGLRANSSNKASMELIDDLVTTKPFSSSVGSFPNLMSQTNHQLTLSTDAQSPSKTSSSSKRSTASSTKSSSTTAINGKMSHKCKPNNNISAANSAAYRYNAEQVALSSYGDSEAESEEDDDEDDEEVGAALDHGGEEDEDDFDSVSVVAARNSSNRSTATKAGKAPASMQDKVLLASPGKAVSAEDSGRGESPESCSSSTGNKNVQGHHVVIRRVGTSQSQSHVPKSSSSNNRPISAVPSEYSDISTSSCRSTTSEAEEEDHHIQHKDMPSSTTTVTLVNSSSNSNGKSALCATASNASTVMLVSDSKEDSRAAKMERAHRVASELLSTEEQYVSILHLIDQVFHFRVDQENRSQNLFPKQDTLPQMFANIKSIYKFHADFLLPQLRERMSNWHRGDESKQRIGDIITSLSPFFKMYTEYVKNFDSAINLINSTYQKNSKFAAIMDEIHAMPECRSLSLQHHMLTPIQRIPRYVLLLKDYIKHLPDDSPDKADSEKALHLVSTAAAHANDAMMRIEKFKKLLEVQESLGGTVDLVSPTREVVKEGRMVKISARSGDHQDRYIFLFTDVLLLCSSRLLSNRVMGSGSGSGPSYRLRARFEVDNMQVLEGDNLVTANTFYIRDDHKSVELYTQTREEKDEWLECLFNTIKELYQRKSSLRVGRETLRPLDSEIGQRQPHLLRFEHVVKCMECGQPFSMMRKKHNCRACGTVVCAKCSSQKYPLSFEENKLCRVCRSCYNLLVFNQKQQLLQATSRVANHSGCQGSANVASNQSCQGSASVANHHSCQLPAAASQDLRRKSEVDHVEEVLESVAPSRPRGLLEVPANAESIMSGFLVLKPGVGSSSRTAKSVKRWFSLLPDFVLYAFRTELDERAMTATPLPGYTVLTGAQLKADPSVAERDRDKIIKMFVQQSSNGVNCDSNVSQLFQKVYYFAGNSVEEVERWAEVLRSATKAETPSADKDPESAPVKVD